MAAGPPRRRPEKVRFQPRFAAMLVWVFLFTALYGTLLAAPTLVEAFRTLPPAEGPLSDAELERARQVGREVLSGARLRWALAAAVVSVGLGAWSRRLPGLR